MSEHEQDSVSDRAAAYVLGALSPEDVRAFEALLEESAEAQRAVAEYREVAGLLALGAPEAAPAPGLRARVLATTPRAVGPTAAGPTAGTASRRRATIGRLALAASLAAAVWLGLQVRNLERAMAMRDETMRAQRAALAARDSMLAERDAVLREILQPGVELYRLRATDRAEPGVQLFWNRRAGRATLSATDLAAPAAGRVYQLWFIRDGTPVPSRTFLPRPDGGVLVREIPVPAGGSLSAAAITEEPAGGSPQPTTPVLLLGPLQPT